MTDIKDDKQQQHEDTIKIDDSRFSNATTYLTVKTWCKPTSFSIFSFLYPLTWSETVSGRDWHQNGNLNSEYISANSSISFSDHAKKVSAQKKTYCPFQLSLKAINSSLIFSIDFFLKNLL